ncbi:hypothetical protein [Streptomyces fungicidicus]|uniref:hypothetical protein n=1 Tax=Streptomyces fungicidicus TaxID=68203 RepID=UPI00380DB924
MTSLADCIELIELMGRYADIADLKDFKTGPGRRGPTAGSAARPCRGMAAVVG